MTKHLTPRVKCEESIKLQRARRVPLFLAIFTRRQQAEKRFPLYAYSRGWHKLKHRDSIQLLLFALSVRKRTRSEKRRWQDTCIIIIVCIFIAR